jgi:Nucleoside transporter
MVWPRSRLLGTAVQPVLIFSPFHSAAVRVLYEYMYAPMQAATAGTAASGVIVALLRVIAKAAAGSTFSALRAATAVYFAVAIAACVATALLYAYHLQRLPLYRHYKERAAAAQLVDVAAASREVRGSGDGALDPEAALLAGLAHPHLPAFSIDQSESVSSTERSPDVMRAAAAPAAPDSRADALASSHGREPLVATDSAGSKLGNGSWHSHRSGALDGAGAPAGRAPEWWRVLRLIAKPTAALFCVYLVTLAIFPGFLSEDVKSVALGSWYPVLLFLVFAAADCASRWAPAPKRFGLSASITRCAAMCFRTTRTTVLQNAVVSICLAVLHGCNLWPRIASANYPVTVDDFCTTARKPSMPSSAAVQLEMQHLSAFAGCFLCRSSRGARGALHPL